MIVISDNETRDKLAAAFLLDLDLADKIESKNRLHHALEYLRTYAERETRCYLYPDFSPYGFNFTIKVKEEDGWKYWFNGGLIYHGSHDNGGDGSSPTYSVNLTPTTGWCIHT
jgi:hypothetical protein